MEALDLAKFLWLHKETKKSYLIMAITTYKEEEDVVVFREFGDRGKIGVMCFSQFCNEHDATYEVP